MKSEKCVKPTISITFLGIELEATAQVAQLRREKLIDFLVQLQAFAKRKRCMKRELLSVIGKLVFAAKVIPAERIFVRRLLDASRRVAALHHCIHINKEMRAVTSWWWEFAESWNGQSFFLENKLQNSNSTLMPLAPSALVHIGLVKCYVIYT